MEKMPTIHWEKEVDHWLGACSYIAILEGVDQDGRAFFYTSKISQNAKADYSLEYQLFTDGNNFKLKPTRGKKSGATTLKAAKEIIAQMYAKQWAKDHV